LIFIMTTAFLSTARCHVLVLVALFFFDVGPIHAFTPHNIRRIPFTPLQVYPTSWTDRILRPKVQAPPGFKAPEPKPLTLTRSSDLPSVLRSALALALRLGTGVFVLGWRVESIQVQFPWQENHSHNNTQYSLSIGPIRFRDSSSVLTSAVARPKKPIILYEYDSSPYCRRVRETLQILDIPVELRPCPSARQSSFSNDLFQRTGRRTVPYMIDPNTKTEMFESTDQIQYLLDTYGPPKEMYDVKALWPITWVDFSVLTSTYAAMIRDFPASTRQGNARADNERMIPLELWGYEASPFVRPVREKLGSLCLPHVLM
jgi:glutaredoxin